MLLRRAILLIIAALGGTIGAGAIALQKAPLELPRPVAGNYTPPSPNVRSGTSSTVAFNPSFFSTRSASASHAEVRPEQPRLRLRLLGIASQDGTAIVAIEINDSERVSLRSGQSFGPYNVLSATNLSVTISGPRGDFVVGINDEVLSFE